MFDGLLAFSGSFAIDKRVSETSSIMRHWNPTVLIKYFRMHPQFILHNLDSCLFFYCIQRMILVIRLIVFSGLVVAKAHHRVFSVVKSLKTPPTKKAISLENRATLCLSLRIGEDTTLKCVNKFAETVIRVFGAEYLRAHNKAWQ